MTANVVAGWIWGRREMEWNACYGRTTIQKHEWYSLRRRPRARKERKIIISHSSTTGLLMFELFQIYRVRRTHLYHVVCVDMLLHKLQKAMHPLYLFRRLRQMTPDLQVRLCEQTMWQVTNSVVIVLVSILDLHAT